MDVRVFTLPFDSAAGGFDDSPVQAWLSGHEASEVRHEFFFKDDAPWLLLVLTGHPIRERSAGRGPVSVRAESAAPARTPPSKPTRDEDPVRSLDPEAAARYERLAAWRRQRAQADGVPTYVVFTNFQLAQIAERAPSSIAELRSIQGVGSGRARRNGEEVLAVLHPERAFTGPEDEAPEADASTGAPSAESSS